MNESQNQRNIRILHTSDWHLGRSLYSRKERQEEHLAFLSWLLKIIKEQEIDLLIVAGDVFDNFSPNNVSQKMYYDFLLKVRNSGCENVVIIAGNHDSPSFLNAPKEILSFLNVTVVGNASENIEDEVVTIKNNDETIAIVCAVPFLRERDISRYVENETYSDRSQRIAQSIKNHYASVAEIAENQRNNKNIPVIATGHLSILGGKKTNDDGVRDLYIGNIECLNTDIFPEIFDYVALGHYHIPSVISENIRYCGSPIHIGFGEAEQQKSIYVVDFEGKKPIINAINIPVFQKLESIQGDKDYIENRLTELKKENVSVWVEIIYAGNEVFPDLNTWAENLTINSKIEILKLQNRQYLSEVLTEEDGAQSLEDLKEEDVFDKLLEKNNISDEQKKSFKLLYNEIIVELNAEN